MNAPVTTPVVMAISGSDPTGGAGIQADIETLASLGCHTAPIITCVTAQDTSNVIESSQIKERMIIEQCRLVLEDISVAAIKIGLINCVETAQVLHTLINEYKNIPVVLDPVIAASGGKILANDSVIEAISNLIIPYTTVVTPNSKEARKLAPEADSLDACAMAILEKGAHFALITGAHENTQDIKNVLYGNNRKLDTRTWSRLPDQYHGSGCTLASALTAYLAHGQDIVSASHQAQEFTWKSLRAARQFGMGQKIPNRFHWLKKIR